MNRRKNLSFYIEALLLTLFLLAALVVLMQVFGAAQQMGQRAREKTDASLILQNASAEWASGESELDGAARLSISRQEEQYLELNYDAGGSRAQDGPYSVSVVFKAEPAQAGALVQATFSVRVSGGDEPIALLNTAHYYPADREGAAS